MKNFFIFILILIISFGGNATQTIHLSLTQLIATPEKYNGKKVFVSGFLHFKFEDSVLYLSKFHADHMMGKEGIWVDYSDEIEFIPSDAKDLSYFDGRAVTLEGIFEYKDELGHGHFGLNSGRLSKTSRVIESKKYYDGSIEIER